VNQGLIRFGDTCVAGFAALSAAGLCVLSCSCQSRSGSKPAARAAASTYEAPLDERSGSAGEARLLGRPVARRAQGGIRICFEVSKPADVEVAILGGGAAVVRHLAAGLLGPHAPEPFRKNSLKQELFWDGRDDRGRPAGETAPGPYRARVRVGARPRLLKTLGRRPDSLGKITAMTVGSGGELFVLESIHGPASARRLVVLDREGRYRRTIMPYSANTPEARAKSVGQLMIDGQRVPVVFNGHAMSLYPLIPNMPRQTMAWNPKGYLIAASAMDSAFEFGLPRHLLAFHPEGGAPPGVSFVGPQISIPTGMIRGLGRSLYHRFDNMACSPDGKYVYYTGGDTRLGNDYYAQPSRHAVFRFSWDEEKGAGMEEPFYGTDCRAGHEPRHLNDPRGLAVDSSGRLYICDRNNRRVMIVSPDGKLVGKFPVVDPEQVAVHPGTGEIYVLCRQRPPDWLRRDHAPMFGQEYRAWRKRARQRWLKRKPRRQTRLVKFSAWKAGEPPREICAVKRDFDLMALDAGTKPPRLWVTLRGRLERLADRGEKLEPDQPDVDRSAGLVRPGHLVADPERKRALVFERGVVKSLDLRTGRVATFLKGLKDMDRAPDGSLYAIRGRKLVRFGPDGKPLPLVPGGAKSAPVGGFNPMGDAGRSLTVAPGGDIYLMRIANEKGVQNRVDVFGPDGCRKKAALVDGLGIGDAGIGVDVRGNLYLGVNVKPSRARLPKDFRDKVPEANWLCWVQWTHQFRGAPWYYSMRNEYLYHYGAVMKFGPEGGAMYGRSPGTTEPFLEAGGGRNRADAAFAEKAPAGAPEYRSGYLYHRVRLAGAKWRFPGTGILPTSERYWGDPTCVCLFSRLDADPYGRVFAPDCFRFRVNVLDSAGNLIVKVGKYGNADDAGAGVRFSWPAYVHVSGDRLYVSDVLSSRVVVVGFEYADRSEVRLPVE